MGWKTKAMLAFAACAGLAAVYYVLPLSPFLSKKKKKTSSKMDDDSSEETTSGCKEDSDESNSDITILKKTSNGFKDTVEENALEDPSEEVAIERSEVIDQGMDPSQIEELPDLCNRYDMYKTLGAGAFGTVTLGIDVTTKETVAIKSIKKKSTNQSYLKQEIDALQTLKHQHINQMYEMFETTDCIYLVLEFCPNGNLLDYISFYNKLQEQEARRIFRQIISAVDYIHSEGYVHRDLKPENIMMDEKNDIKLIDFGLSSKPEGGLDTPLQDMRGTIYYMPPEAFTGYAYLGAEADIWSIGIILYNMLCGSVPFYVDYEEDQDETFLKYYTKVSSGDFDVPDFVSEESKWLLWQLLWVEPDCRVTMDELLHHPWVLKGYDGPVECLV